MATHRTSKTNLVVRLCNTAGAIEWALSPKHPTYRSSIKTVRLVLDARRSNRPDPKHPLAMLTTDQLSSLLRFGEAMEASIGRRRAR